MCSDCSNMDDIARQMKNLRVLYKASSSKFIKVITRIPIQFWAFCTTNSKPKITLIRFIRCNVYNLYKIDNSVSINLK